MEDITTAAGEVVADSQQGDIDFDGQSGNIAAATTRGSSHASGQSTPPLSLTVM
jgi:hypothetical protein